jgi:nucleotide-binding universal stress UspA family protein
MTTTYRTVVVGTDGSDSSMRAVDRAGAIAAAENANLIVASAYFPHADDTRSADTLRDEGYKVTGLSPVCAILRDARDRAKEAGAADINQRPILGAPVEALLDLSDEVDADLLVVGSVGLGTISGRLLGSVPASISRKAKVDVLIVHTT